MAEAADVTRERLGQLCEEVWQVILTDSIPQLENKLNSEPAEQVIEACKLKRGEAALTLLHRVICHGDQLVNKVGVMSTLLTFLRENERYHDECNEIVLIGDGEDESCQIDGYGGDTILHKATRIDDLDMIRTILYSIPEEEDRVILINTHNNCVLLDEIPPSSEGDETALHHASTEALKLCLESVSSQEDRLEMLLREADQNLQVIRCWLHDPDLIYYILTQAVSEEQHWLELLMCKNNSNENCLYEAVRNNYVGTVDVIVDTLCKSDDRQSLVELALDENKIEKVTAAFAVKSDDMLKSISNLMQHMNEDEKLKFLCPNPQKNTTIFHKFVECAENLPFLKHYLNSVTYSSLVDLLRRKSRSGFTALHEAAIRGNTDSMRLIHGMLMSEDWNALMMILVTDNEMGGIEVRNEWISKMGGRDMCGKYRSNCAAINHRHYLAGLGELPPPSDVSRGDSPLNYAVINNHRDTMAFIIESIDSETLEYLRNLKDIVGLTVQTATVNDQTYHDQTVQLATEIKWD